MMLKWYLLFYLKNMFSAYYLVDNANYSYYRVIM